MVISDYSKYWHRPTDLKQVSLELCCWSSVEFVTAKDSGTLYLCMFVTLSVCALSSSFFFSFLFFPSSASVLLNLCWMNEMLLWLGVFCVCVCLLVCLSVHTAMTWGFLCLCMSVGLSVCAYCYDLGVSLSVCVCWSVCLYILLWLGGFCVWVCLLVCLSMHITMT